MGLFSDHNEEEVFALYLGLHSMPNIWNIRIFIIIWGRADKFCLHIKRKWRGKDILMKRKACISYFSKLHNYFSTKSPRTSIHFRQRCTRFWNPAFNELVFCFWNNFLTADFTSSTSLPSVLLYSHQHTDNHKRLAFVCEFQLEEFFPRFRIQ